MAQRDLARKKKSTRRSGASPKPVKKPVAAKSTKKRRPVFLIIVVVLLIAGFGFFLAKLVATSPVSEKTSSQPAKQGSEQKPAPPKPVVTNEQPAAETPEKKRFEFYDELPKSEVTTADPSQYKSTPRDQISEVAYDLQISSFRQKEAAEQLRAQLILQGLPSVRTSQSVVSSGDVWYRVVSGPFNNRPQLESARNKLEKLGYMPIRLKAAE